MIELAVRLSEQHAAAINEPETLALKPCVLFSVFISLFYSLQAILHMKMICHCQNTILLLRRSEALNK